MLKHLLQILCVLVFAANILPYNGLAQDAPQREIITNENADKVQLLKTVFDGSLLATHITQDNNTIYLMSSVALFVYARNNLNEPQFIMPLKQYPNRIAFSPNDRYIAYSLGYRDREFVPYQLYIIDMVTQETYGFGEYDDHIVVSMRFSEDGSRLVTGEDKNRLRVWDTANRRLITTLVDPYISTAESTPEKTFWKVDMNPNNITVVAADGDGHLYHWDDINTTNPPGIKRLADSGLYAIKFSHNGEWLAFSYLTRNEVGQISDQIATVMHWPNWTQIAQFQFQDKLVIEQIAFTEDDTHIILAHEPTLSVWDMQTFQQVYETEETNVVNNAVFAHATEISWINDFNQITFVNFMDNTDFITVLLDNFSAPMRNVFFVGDGSTMVSGGAGADTLFWTIGDINISVEETFPAFQIIGISADGTRLAGANLGIEIYDTTTRTMIANNYDFLYTAMFITDMKISLDGQWVIAGYSSAGAGIYSTTTGERLWSMGTPDGTASMMFSPDSQAVVALGYQWRYFDDTVPSFQSLDSLDDIEGLVVNMGFSPDGQLLALAAGNLYIMDVATKTVIRDCGRLYSYYGVFSTVFSPDATLIAVAFSDGIIDLFDSQTCEHLIRLHEHTSSVGGLAFNTDGTVLVSVSADGTIRFWGLPTD